MTAIGCHEADGKARRNLLKKLSKQNKRELSQNFCVRSVTASQGFEQSSWRLTCGDLVARVPPSERERERVSKRASEQAAERASERARERDRVAQGRWSESGTLSRLAAAAGLAPDVKFSCGKAQLYFTV